ncbi:trehalose 6-phosphate synthase [Thermoproteota archaeon]
MGIQSLRQFYNIMFKSQKIRKAMVQDYLDKGIVSETDIKELKEILTSLEAIPQTQNQLILTLNHKQILIDISYESNELKKDIFFFTHTEKEFYNFLSDLHPSFKKEVNKCAKLLEGRTWKNFMTDRDGTINNYCGRYISSIQSAYNAVFLTRFAQSCAENSLILTSAPLQNKGLVDISTAPENAFIYAGSKGREFINTKGRVIQFPIKPEKQKILNILNRRLTELAKNPDYEIFSLIGSGLQFKFGQTTIARQDIYESIPEPESLNFLSVITDIVKDIDPDENELHIEDTGKDIEIILTIKEKGSKEFTDFDKGHGIDFIDKSLKLDMESGPNLICGDTKSDIAMLITSLQKTENTCSIFVTQDDELKKLLKRETSHICIVSEPDILVSILNSTAVKRKGTL